MANSNPNSDFRWNDLDIVVVIERTGSLGRAAAELGVSQSTVSRRLAELEEALNTQLFTRTVEGVIATDAMKVLHPLAEQMQQLAVRISTQLRNLDDQIAGQVRLALPEGLVAFLIPRIPMLRRQYPLIELELLSSVGQVDMNRDEADIAIRFVRPVRGPFVVKRIGSVEYAVFGSRTHKKRLADADWISWTMDHNRVPDAAWLVKNYPRANCVLRLGSMRGIAHAVQEGVGVALLPKRIGESLSGVVSIPTTYKTPNIPLWLVVHKDKAPIARIRVVSEFVARMGETTGVVK